MSRLLFAIPSLVWGLLWSLAGCSASSDWICDGIAAQDPLFDSKRLVHEPLTGSPPWRIEFFRFQEEISLFVSLKQCVFRPLPKDPGYTYVALHIREGEKTEIVEGKGALFIGQMKVEIPSFLTEACVRALQTGREVVLVVDTLRETLRAQTFKEPFSQFLENGYNWYWNIQPANKAFL